MYEEIIQRLRETSMDFGEADHVSAMLLEAADVIEEEDMNFRHLERDYKDLCRYLPKWIPVTERLPDTMKDKSAYSGWSAEIAPSDDVLCYLGSEKRQTVAWYSHTYKEWTTVDENTVYRYGEVTHWMPLPSAPMEE